MLLSSTRLNGLIEVDEPANRPYSCCIPIVAGHLCYIIVHYDIKATNTDQYGSTLLKIIYSYHKRLWLHISYHGSWIFSWQVGTIPTPNPPAAPASTIPAAKAREDRPDATSALELEWLAAPRRCAAIRWGG